MGKASPVTGSLDMLLDTMSNTFGGVCFIALLIAIMSVNLPSTPTEDGGEDIAETERRLAEMRSEDLTRRNGELKKAISLQRENLAETNGVLSASAAKMLSILSSNETAVARLQVERLELEDRLSRTQEEGDRKAAEARRLIQRNEEMEERLCKPQNFKSRPVRMPDERRIEGLKTVSIWLRNGRCYVLEEGNGLVDKYANVVEGRDANGKTWDVSIKYSAGIKVTTEFFHSEVYKDLVSKLDSKSYLRIFTDTESFAELCLFRDDMIRRNILYNWLIRDGEKIHFVEGYDGQVQ